MISQQKTLNRIELLKQKSVTYPKKVIKVTPGFYWLTCEDGNTYKVIHDRDEHHRWYAYSEDDDSLYTDEYLTKKGVINCLLTP